MAQCFVIEKDKAVNVFNCKQTPLYCFFQLQAPSIDSFQSISNNPESYSRTLTKMLKKWNEENACFINPQARINKRLKNLDMLHTESIKCKGMRFVVRRKNPKENNLACLLRHMRNSIAHGRVFTKEVGGVEYILFDDTVGDTCTARIICTEKELIRWKDLICKAHS